MTTLLAAVVDASERVARLRVGELRQGALEGVMIDAIAAAADVPAADVRRAAMVTGDPGVVARVALAEGGVAGLARFAIALHRPVQPMLAQPADGIAAAFAQLGSAAVAVEWKVDGARVQVHKSGGRSRSTRAASTMSRPRCRRWSRRCRRSTRRS